VSAAVKSGKAGLVLFGEAGPDDPLGWAQVDLRTGAVLASGLASKAGDAPAAALARTVLVLSGSEAQVRRIALRAHSEAQARKGAELSFEGALAEVDGVHYAVGSVQDEAGGRLAAAISADRLQAWLAACRRLGAEPTAAFLDVTLWPVGKDEAALVEIGARTLAAGGLFGGYAIESNLAPALFGGWARQNGVVLRRVEAPAALHGALQASGGLGDAALVAGELRDPLTVLAGAALAPPAHAPNLRQGPFSARGGGRDRGPRWRLWSLAAALAVLAVLVQSGVQAVAGARDAEAAAQVRARAEAAFKDARPQTTRIVNLQAQVRAALNARDQAGAHPVLKTSAPLLQAQRAHPLTRLDQLSHRGPGPGVTLRFSAPEAAALDQLATGLRAQGLKVEARGLAPEGGRYVMEMVVEAAP
jgi:general secretion pathway protein L